VTPRLIVSALLMAIPAAFSVAQEEPAPLPLWPDQPPQLIPNAPPETRDSHDHIANVSRPTLIAYLPPKTASTGLALIVCPGGAYRLLDWTTHVVDTALYFNPRGIAVIGLKYRTSPPNPITKANREIPLMDLKRAVRLVRSHAAEWNIDPNKIGVLGFSAGANLALTLAASFDEGDQQSTDPVEKISSRPDFVIGCSTWHWREKTSPFVFSKKTPPVFLIHATNDGLPDKNGNIVGAPIELPYAIQKQLEDLGVPVHLEIYNVGGHGVGHLTPQRVQQGFPSTKWPEILMKWLSGLDSRSK